MCVADDRSTSVTSSVLNVLKVSVSEHTLGPFKCYVTQMGVRGGVQCSGEKRYEGIRFNVIIVTRGWVGVQFPEKKRYITFEWPQADDRN